REGHGRSSSARRSNILARSRSGIGLPPSTADRFSPERELCANVLVLTGLHAIGSRLRWVFPIQDHHFGRWSRLAAPEVIVVIKLLLGPRYAYDEDRLIDACARARRAL